VALSSEALSAFIADLRASGYAPDPGQLSAAHHLVLLSASGAWPGGDTRLGHLLAPVFARTPAEQSDIIRRFEAWRPMLFPKGGATALVKSPILPPLRLPKLEAIPDTQIGTVVRLSRLRTRWIVAAFALALLVTLAVGATAVLHEFRPVFPPPVVAPIGPILPPSKSAETQTPFRSVIGPSSVSTPLSTRPVSGIAVAPAWSAALPVVLGSLPVAIAIALWLSSRGHRHRWRRLAESRPRDLAEMNILVPDMPLFEGVACELAAHDLARPRRLFSEELDIDQSVDATVRAGGMAQLAYKTRSLTPLYAVLIEEEGRHDHLARLGDILSSRLSDAGVLSESYHVLHADSVRDSNDRILSLNELADRHREDRLLMLGAGEKVLDRRNQLSPVLRREAPWADRGYLVLGRIDAFTARQLINEDFFLAPASPAGMRALGQRIASAPRERGEMLIPVPGVMSRFARSIPAAAGPAKVLALDLGLDEIRARLVALLRAPLAQISAIILQRAESSEGQPSGEDSDRRQIGVPILNRHLLRQFLTGLNGNNPRHRVLVVNGPPGSGKDFTIRVAHRLVRPSMQIVILHLDELSNVHEVVHSLYRKFGWGNAPPAAGSVPTERIIRDYAQYLRYGAQRDDTKILMIFQSDNSAAVSPSIIDLIILLVNEPDDLSFIIIGLDVSIFSSSSIDKSSLIIEEIHDFTKSDIEYGLREIFNELNIPVDYQSVYVDHIVASVEPGDEYNKRVAAEIHRLMVTLTQRHLPTASSSTYSR
jgi:hypothetical protein